MEIVSLAVKTFLVRSKAVTKLKVKILWPCFIVLPVKLNNATEMTTAVRPFSLETFFQLASEGFFFLHSPNSMLSVVWGSRLIPEKHWIQFTWWWWWWWLSTSSTVYRTFYKIQHGNGMIWFSRIGSSSLKQTRYTYLDTWRIWSKDAFFKLLISMRGSQLWNREDKAGMDSSKCKDSCFRSPFVYSKLFELHAKTMFALQKDNSSSSRIQPNVCNRFVTKDKNWFFLFNKSFKMKAKFRCSAPAILRSVFRTPFFSELLSTRRE